MQKLLGNISLKRKLQLLTFLPLFGLIIFITNMLKDSYTQVVSMDKLSHVVKITDDVAHLVKYQEIERSLTSGFISSKGKKFENELYEARGLTDKFYIKVHNYFKKDILEKDVRERFIKSLTLTQKTLQKVRSQINKNNVQNTKTVNALNFYTRINSDLLSVLLDLSHYSSISHVTTQIISLYNLLATKDDIELIRSYGVNLINELENESDEQEKNIIYSQVKLKSLLGSSEQKLDIYLKVANIHNNNFYKKTIKGKNFEEYNNYVRSLANDNDLDLYEGESDVFYQLASKKIKLFDAIEKEAIKYLDDDIKKLKNDAQIMFITNIIVGGLLFFFTLTLGFMIFKKISSDMNLLKSNLLDFFDFIAKKKKGYPFRKY